jgi:small subunit ribosomal protein S11
MVGVPRFLSSVAQIFGQGRLPTAPVPRVLVHCRTNNLFVHVSDPDNPARAWLHLSAGRLGFKGTAKTSPKAALAMMDRLQTHLAERGIDTIGLEFRGINPVRPVVMSQLRRTRLRVRQVMDSTPIPFNGCRPRKSRSL